MSLAQLHECEAILEEVATLLKKYRPRNSENVGKYLKSLVWALRKDGQKSIMARLERQKSTLELIFLGFSVYLCFVIECNRKIVIWQFMRQMPQWKRETRLQSYERNFTEQ